MKLRNTAVPDRRLGAPEPESPDGERANPCDRGGVRRVDELGCPPDSSRLSGGKCGSRPWLGGGTWGTPLVHHKDSGSTSFMSRKKCIIIIKYCHYTFARSPRPTEYFQSVGGKRPSKWAKKGKHALEGPRGRFCWMCLRGCESANCWVSSGRTSISGGWRTT
jgi:hypothetical protein